MTDGDDFPTDAELATLGERVDFHECGPCGGRCCRTPWTVLVTPRDVARLQRATGRVAREFADLAPLPEWERESFGDANLLYPSVTNAEGEVPQLKKREGGACVFLDERGLCGVHDRKPLMCRLFPFYYERPPYSAAERPSPLGTRTSALRLLTDRGHEGRCPITRERMAAVEAASAPALVRLMEAFESDVARFAAEKEAYAAAWRDGAADAVFPRDSKGK